MTSSNPAISFAAAVLAGGQSRRFGQDKALLTLGGRTLLERTVSALRSLTAELLVIGPPERALQVSGVRVIADAMPGLGPLAGIATVLQNIQADRALVVGCDMPFLNPALLSHLVACSDGYDITVPRVDGRPEPLHAVYHRSCLPVITAQLGDGDGAVHHVLPKLHVRYVEEAELRTLDPELCSLRNVNTPADWDAVLQCVSRGASPG